MKYGAYPLPCETFSSGEVEDYMLNFSMDEAIFAGTDEIPSMISVYPNPTRDFINIITGSDQSEAFIYDMNGALLKHCEIKSQDMIDLQNLPKGIYCIRILSNGTVYTRKIIRQ
jgi:hypothetical protein